MKKAFYLVLLTLVSGTVMAQGHQITVKSANYKNGIAYLAYYMGENIYIEDSAAISNTGIAMFKGRDKLQPGIYLIVLPDHSKRTDLLIDKEQTMTVSVDTVDMINKTVISGSRENIPYMTYQKYIGARGKLINEEKQAYTYSLTAADSAIHKKNIEKYNKEINDYRLNIIKTEPNSMLAVLLKAMWETPALPENPITHQDSVDRYNYYKKHYWDGVTFMDDRVIRTPFFPTMLERYYREVVHPAPDSIIKDIDYKLLLARNAPEMYKYLLNWLTDEYIYPKYMGQDAIFVHLVDKYHSKGLSPWLNEKQNKTIFDRFYSLVTNQVGVKSVNLKMVDSTGRSLPLHDVQADYILVAFWDPNCGHCKETVPKVDSIYRANWKAHNLKIYGVLAETEKVKDAWVNYIKEHDLGDWINVYQTDKMRTELINNGELDYHQAYDIRTTPTFYLLDKEKRIIGKNLTWEQMNDLLQVKWKTKP